MNRELAISWVPEGSKLGRFLKNDLPWLQNRGREVHRDVRRSGKLGMMLALALFAQIAAHGTDSFKRPTTHVPAAEFSAW